MKKKQIIGQKRVYMSLASPLDPSMFLSNHQEYEMLTCKCYTNGDRPFIQQQLYSMIPFPYP